MRARRRTTEGFGFAPFWGTVQAPRRGVQHGNGWPAILYVQIGAFVVVPWRLVNQAKATCARPELDERSIPSRPEVDPGATGRFRVDWRSILERPYGEISPAVSKSEAGRSIGQRKEQLCSDEHSRRHYKIPF